VSAETDDLESRTKRQRFERVPYDGLNARQKETFNFQKVSAVLAEYGFTTIRLSSDWSGADFIAQHKDGSTFLKVQLKGRLTFDKKYEGRDLHICFPYQGQWFVYPHDDLLQQILASGVMTDTRSWRDDGCYHFPRLSANIRRLLEPYRIEQKVSALEE
jgi:hypothetical protein